MAIEIVDAVSPDLREAVFAFRYAIYVREMKRAQKDADHGVGRIEDALDASAVLLAARDTATGRVAGTVRGNVLSDGGVGPYEDLYGLGSLTRADRRATSITTRLMIERHRRGTALAVQLASALFERGVERGIETDFIDCNAHPVPFFEGLGYRAVRMIRHPDYGAVTLMRLDVRDLTHLRRVGSPLATVLERFTRVA